MKKIKLATIWLDGCSGCHMSLLDLDTALIPMARKVDLVYGPLVDAQEFPEDVDLTLIEGAVSTPEDVEKVQTIRQRSRLVVALGDCAVTGNVAALRNTVSVRKLLTEIYLDGVRRGGCIPNDALPPLEKLSRPVQDFIKVDVCLPGCPTPSKLIATFLNTILDGRKPETGVKVKFG
jgi:NAD-reducing hydrogenase small subunit